jgi:hypothetical protein
MDFLQEMDQWLSQHEVSNPSRKSERLGVGLYFIAGENDSFPNNKKK